MSDINAAPSSTEPADNPNWTPEQLAEIQARNVVPMQINQIAEAGTAKAGESASGAEEKDFTSASSGSADSTSADAPLDSASSTNTGSASEADAPAVAAQGEGDASAASAAIATSMSNAEHSGDAGGAAADAGNVVASPAAGQSASDTASSVQDASRGDGTAAVVWIDSDSEARALNLESQLTNARATIAKLQQQVTNEQERVIKWQSMYNAACAAKPHAQSLLQKLEAGEAIVLGDLQSRLRAFVDAL